MTNQQKAKELLAQQGMICCCAQPKVAQTNSCGTVMGKGMAVSYTAKRCTLCKGIILATVH